MEDGSSHHHARIPADILCGEDCSNELPAVIGLQPLDRAFPAGLTRTNQWPRRFGQTLTPQTDPQRHTTLQMDVTRPIGEVFDHVARVDGPPATDLIRGASRNPRS